MLPPSLSLFVPPSLSLFVPPSLSLFVPPSPPSLPPSLPPLPPPPPVLQVIVLWTANTERFCDVEKGLNDTAENLLRSIANDEEEVSPSTIFAVACVLEGVSNKVRTFIY